MKLPILDETRAARRLARVLRVLALLAPLWCVPVLVPLYAQEELSWTIFRALAGRQLALTVVAASVWGHGFWSVAGAVEDRLFIEAMTRVSHVTAEEALERWGRLERLSAATGIGRMTLAVLAIVFFMALSAVLASVAAGLALSLAQSAMMLLQGPVGAVGVLTLLCGAALFLLFAVLPVSWSYYSYRTARHFAEVTTSMLTEFRRDQEARVEVGRLRDEQGGALSVASDSGATSGALSVSETTRKVRDKGQGKKS